MPGLKGKRLGFLLVGGTGTDSARGICGVCGLVDELQLSMFSSQVAQDSHRDYDRRKRKTCTSLDYFAFVWRLFG